jgi:hemoglobin
MTPFRMPRLLAFTIALAGAGATRATAQAPQPAPSLYQRLGGYDAIAAVTDDFIGRLVTNPQFTKFFAGHGTDSKMRIRQHIVNQQCKATGGPCVYTGRDMKTTHAGLGITQADWDAAVRDLTATLAKFKVPQKEQGEVLAAVSTMKADIVEKP